MKIVVYVISFLTLVFFALSWHSKISSRNYESDSANVDGAGPTIVNDWDSTNLSSWKRENVKDLFELMLNTKDEEDWPITPFDTNDINSTKSRRRLSDFSDRWDAEEKEFMQELRMKRKMPQNNPQTSSLRRGDSTQKAKLENTMIEAKKDNEVSRQMQLPPVSKTCNDPSATDVPCPPRNISQICDKYNNGNFEDCFQTCKPSVCCTHDSKRALTRSCAETAPNCENWIPCYIVWWKLSDTVGPAPFLRLVQEDDFFNVDVNYIKEEINFADENNNVADILFYDQWFNRFIDDDENDLDDRMFEKEDLWIEYSNKR